MHWFSTDEIRSFNSFMAAVGWALLTWEIVHVWRDVNIARRMRYIALTMFALAVAYGSLEAAFWPRYQFRLALIAVAVLSMVAAGVIANKNSEHH